MDAFDGWSCCRGGRLPSSAFSLEEEPVGPQATRSAGRRHAPRRPARPLGPMRLSAWAFLALVLTCARTWTVRLPQRSRTVACHSGEPPRRPWRRSRISTSSWRIRPERSARTILPESSREAVQAYESEWDLSVLFSAKGSVQVRVNAEALLDALYLVLHNAAVFGLGKDVVATVSSDGEWGRVLIQDGGPGFSGRGVVQGV